MGLFRALPVRPCFGLGEVEKFLALDTSPSDAEVQSALRFAEVVLGYENRVAADIGIEAGKIKKWGNISKAKIAQREQEIARLTHAIQAEEAAAETMRRRQRTLTDLRVRFAAFVAVGGSAPTGEKSA